MNEQTVKSRSEMPEEFTWDLSCVFPDDAAWTAAYEELKTSPSVAASMAGTLGKSAADLLKYFQWEEETQDRLGRLILYASCRSDEDTANGVYQDLRGKAIGVWVAIDSASAFAAPEILAIPEETLERFFSEEPELERFRRPLYRIRRRAAHTLSPECETLLSAAGEMAEAPDRINGVFRDADITFPAVTDAAGTTHPLTDGTFVPLLESTDRDLRRKTFEAYYHRIGEMKNTFAATLDAQFKQLNFFASARHYASTLEASLDANEVPLAVYDNLIAAVRENLDKMHRYVSLRKRFLGADELHMYDVYAPMVPDTARVISYEEAQKTVLDALAVLGEDYTALLRKGFSERWIDVYENTGKRGGAYSTDASRPHPFVLLNHKDNLDSMFTLAHEMGHALHSYHSTEHQPPLTAEYVIFVAEVASTCNEVLLMRYLLGKTEDRRERAYLINHFLDQFKGTIYRQTMFAEFEREMGRLAEAGETLTADTLCALYGKLNREYYGPDMVCDEEIALEWARIPHFFMNYYVFQYATGFSAAVAIADRILREGAPAVADYKRFLSAGSSTDPISLLKIAGVDMSTPAPINDALRLFGQLLDEMETL